LRCAYGIPLVWAADRDAAPEAYVQLYLREEIRAEARNLGKCVSFPSRPCFMAGRQRFRHCAARASRATVTALKSRRHASCTGSREAKLRVREPLYWADLTSALKKAVMVEEIGPLFEGFVLHCCAHAEEQALFDRLTCGHRQGDAHGGGFLLRRRRIHAIEVKASKRFERSMAQGLRIAVPGVVRHPRLWASVIARGRYIEVGQSGD
jgi:hypothetical protein